MPKKNLEFLLFIIGLILISFSLSWKIYQGQVLSFKQTEISTQVTKVKTENPLPTGILIPHLGIDLLVTESKIIQGVWEINPSGGSHLDQSPRPGEPGNIIIYGHNKKELFGKALDLKKGDQIIITTTDMFQHIYYVDSIQTVAPTAVEVLAPTAKEVLTFYTCTGFLDSKRFVVKAKPI